MEKRTDTTANNKRPVGQYEHNAIRDTAEIDKTLIEAYRGTVSLPFAPGTHARVAVKIVGNRGIVSLKILEVQ